MRATSGDVDTLAKAGRYVCYGSGADEPLTAVRGGKRDIDERRLGVPNVEAEDDQWLIHFSLRTSV